MHPQSVYIWGGRRRRGIAETAEMDRRVSRTGTSRRRRRTTVRLGGTLQDTATRLRGSGREHAFFTGDPGSKIFVASHMPAAPRASVLICSSILTDIVSNYHLETRLSRVLADADVAVGRFHYRGNGHSEGDPLAATFDSMVDDARHVMTELSQQGAPEPWGFVGSRFGALVAARVASSHPSSPVAMLEATARGKRFFTDALMAQSAALASGKLVAPKPKELLAREGWADVMGFPAGHSLIDSATELDLVDLLQPAERPVLFMAPAKAGGLKSTDQALVDQLRAADAMVDVETTDEPKSWWFIDDFEAVPTRAADTAAQWLIEHLAAT